jgi:hypothetical protein
MSNAAAILAACNDVPAAGRFGSNKVFIHAAYAQLGGAAQGWTLEEFKAECVALHLAGELSLSRLDMVGEVDAATVTASNTYHPSFAAVVWNLIRIV